MSKIFILMFWLVFLAQQVFTQTDEIKIQPYSCERNIAILRANHQVAGESNLIILIARLGDGENNTSLNRRRLYNAKTYLTFFWKRDPKTIVLAQGERVERFGRIEIYVNGMLTDVVAVKRNGDLPVGSCETNDKIFYPQLDEKLRSKKIKLNGQKKA